MWLFRIRLEFLASIFGIDVLTYTILSNHIHHVLRSRPDVVADWNNREVVERYWRLHPQRKNKDGSAADPTQAELNIWLNDAVKMQLLRRRLSDISWFMSRLSQTIALKANFEDSVSGRFWEGRFKSQALLDESSILACAMYVDLNPIRAAMAQKPETSDFTGAKDQLDDLQSVKSSSVTSLDWTGRNLASGKRGAIPDHLDPILKRVGIASSGWCDLIENLGVCSNGPLDRHCRWPTKPRLEGKSICKPQVQQPSFLVSRCPAL